MSHDVPKGVYISGQGPAVIMLHSSLSSARQWSPLVKKLEQEHLVINIDILGYGRADRVVDEENYNFDVEIQRINVIIDKIIPQQNYHLVGHSCGGAIALKLAVEAPQRLLSIALYEPVPFHLLAQGSEERAQSELFAASVAIEDNHQAAEIFTNYWNREGFFKSLPDKMQNLMARDMPKVSLDFKGLMAETYTLDDLVNINCRVLLMVGEFSPQLSKSLTEKIESMLINVSHHTVKSGHMGPVSHSDIIHPVMAKFIRSSLVS